MNLKREIEGIIGNDDIFWVITIKEFIEDMYNDSNEGIYDLKNLYFKNKEEKIVK